MGHVTKLLPLGPASSPWGGLGYLKPLGPCISGGHEMLSPALGLLPATSRFVIFQVGLTIIIASTYRVPCECFICSKTAVIILKRGAEVFNCMEYRVTWGADQKTGVGQPEDLGNKSEYFQKPTP